MRQRVLRQLPNFALDLLRDGEGDQIRGFLVVIGSKVRARRLQYQRNASREPRPRECFTRKSARLSPRNIAYFSITSTGRPSSRGGPPGRVGPDLEQFELHRGPALFDGFTSRVDGPPVVALSKPKSRRQDERALVPGFSRSVASTSSSGGSRCFGSSGGGRFFGAGLALAGTYWGVGRTADRPLLPLKAERALAACARRPIIICERGAAFCWPLFHRLRWGSPCWQQRLYVFRASGT